MFSLRALFGRSKQQSTWRSPRFSALITVRPACALLVLHVHSAAVALVTETLPNVIYVADIRTIITNHDILSTIPPSQYPEWGWKSQKQLLERLEPHQVTAELRERSRLAVRRTHALSRIINEVNNVRSKIDTGLIFQETVYMAKRLEAERFKASGYDESLIAEIPHILQSANQAGVMLRQAADDILFNAALDDAFLAKTESLRMKYFAEIKKATDDDEFPKIINRFLLDCNSKQLV